MNIDNAHKMMKAGLRHSLLLLLVMMTGSHAMAQESQGVRIHGSVFGGGNEADVQTTTQVNICTGQVDGNVYGGGNLGDVGTINDKSDKANYTWTGTNNQPNTSGGANNTGVCTVEITGGTIGNSGTVSIDHGNVFGGGKGNDVTYKENDNTISFYCEKGMVYSTAVKIKDGTVYGNVYGGGQIARVESHTVVTIGDAGATGEGSAPDIKHNVFGAGAGVATHGYSALVRGNPIVTIQGKANVGGNVYGGGEIASVGKHKVKTPANQTDSSTPLDLPMGMPFTLDNTNSGKCTVNIIGGTITGDVFGAGMGVEPAFDENNKPRRMGMGGWEEPFATYAEYLVFVYTLALTTDTYVTIGGTRNADGTVSASGAPIINGSVYGGSENGFVQYHTNVNIIGGQVGTDVYGGGKGFATFPDAGRVSGYAQITVSGGSVGHDVYGGGKLGLIKGGVNVDMRGGTVGNDVYGGGALANTNTANGLEYIVVPGLTVGESSVVGLYVRTYKQTTDATAQAGKTYYEKKNNTYVVKSMPVGYSVSGLYESEYTEQTSGTAAANTTYYSNTLTTTVNLLSGIISGNAYGGALGDATHEPNVCGDILVELNKNVTTTKGCVVNQVFGCNNANGTPLGKVTVHVYATQHGDESMTTTSAKYNPPYCADQAEEESDKEYLKRLIDAATQSVDENTHEITWITGVDAATLTAAKATYDEGNATAEDLTSAINSVISAFNAMYDVAAVYGGGNEADYTPTDTRQSTEVIIEGCDYTSIKNVYGGGNAAAVPATEVWIVGSKIIDNVFGGGNGERGAEYAAHVGYHRNNDLSTTPYYDCTGQTNVKLIGGKINTVYGGSNLNGDIRGNETDPENPYGSNITMPTLAEYNDTHDPDASTCTLNTKHIYGGGKKANMSSGTNIVLGCMPDGWIDEIYAGAKAADVAGDVSLTITSGKFGRVFGGNKDSGKLEGSITVNIEETGGCDVPIVIGELYGGGNMAGYSIYGYDSNGDPIENEADKTVTTPYADPQVNVRAFTSIGAIYGGGYSALMVGNPTIDINVAKGSHAENDAIHTETEGNVNYFPEGNTETTPSLPYPAHKYGEIGAIGNVYGGGNLANVIGNTAINIGTKTEIPFISTPSHLTKNTETNKYPVSGANITGNVYGGGNAADIIGNTTVTIGTVDLTAKDGTKIGGDVFGGGFGPTTTVTGNVQVNIGAETDDDYVGYATISGNVYGGSAEGKVNATKSGTESITYTVSNGTPTTEVNFYGGTITRDLYGGGYGLDDKEADVYGAVTVNVYKGSTTSTTVTNVFGGNNLSGVTRNTVDVNIAGGTISENVYGGGNAADALGDVTVTVTDGSMVDVFGGGFGQTTVVSGNVEVNIGEKNGNTLSGNGTITGNVYGGSAMGAVNATKDPSTGELTPASNKTTAVKIYAFESLTGSVFGGGLGVDDSDDTNDVIAKNYGNTTVTMEGGTVGTAVYGGANINGTLKAKSTVTITGGTVGTAPAANEAIKDVVFGGGFGQPTLVEGDVEVNIGSEGQTTGGAIIHGSVYGGSALGNVNAYDNNGTLTASTYLDDENETAYRGTNVNLNKGTINGNLYGGGLGRQYAAAVQGVAEVLYTAQEATDYNTEHNLSEGDAGYVHEGDVKVAGVQAQDPISAVYANVYGPVTVTVNNGEVTDVFGCNNLNGSPQKDVDVIIEGGTIDNVYGGGNLAAYTGNSGTEVSMSGGTVNYVYGGGLGETAVVNGSTSVTISNGTVNQNVFGGGQQADVTGNVGVTIGDISNTSNIPVVTGDVYGGGAFAHTNTGNWNDNTYVQVPTTNGVSLVTGLYTQNGNTYTEIPTPNTRAADGTTYYQKGNWIDGMNDATYGTTYKTTVSLRGGIVGNAYGGGLGQMGMAEIQAEVARNYTQEECNAYNATLVGAIAGGTQLSSTQVTAVNEALSTSYTDNQQISEADANSYNATLPGARIYGTAVKPAVAYAAAVEPIEANVYGDVSVTVNGTAFTHSFETPIDATGTAIPNALDVPTTGRVFGCNNLNGTPKGDVLVEVHRTRRITDAGRISDDHQENVFEIHSVYGGGNLATYQPAEGKATKVRIYGCKDTSIEKVFGGGNSASVPSTDVQILGTFYVGYAFSGGNGADWYQNGNVWYENNGAPVYGNATILAVGGKIGQIFGGSDTKGNVYGSSTTQLNGKDFTQATDCPLQITNAYGAARGADIEGDVNFIVSGCNADDQIERVFGGSYDANIRGGITLTITGGTFAQVFGGNDHGGTIGGEINVNIEETEPECNPIIIQYLYGGGREAEYPGTGAKYITNEIDANGNYIGTLAYSAFPNASAGKIAKINVNVKSATRIDNIYGGSYRAIVNGNTEVNINMMKGNYVGRRISFPDTYRGDQIPNVDSPEGTYVEVEIPNPLPTDGYSVAGLYTRVALDTEPVTYEYTRITDQDAVAEEGKTYYRLTRMSGTIQDDIGTIGNVFGGGYEGTVKGNTKINIGTETKVPILKRLNGAIVGADDQPIYDNDGKLIPGKTVVYNSDNDVLGAHITGNVYGGGENGDITGTTSVYIGTKDGSTIVPVGDSGISIAGNVFGGGKGAADNFYCNKAMVGIDGEGAIDANNDGEPDNPNGGTTVIIANGTVGTIENGKLKVGTGNVYGGGQIARVEKNSVVTIGLGEGVATGTPTSAPVIQGDVFGAGRGVNTHGYSALLRGNPTVTIQGNTKVRGSVYGGGEIASVARYNVVDGVPIALQNNWSGKCRVTVQGYAEIGPKNNMTMPTFTGNVFGAGKGVLPYEGYTDTQKPSQVLPTGTKYFASKQEVGDGEDDDYFSFIETLALSSQTDVTIGGHAFVKGSVYGGSQNGIVQYDTKVTIQDDCQIGAGQGMTTRHDPSVWAANYTPTDANDLECASWTYGQATGDNKFAPYDKFAGTSGYTSYASTTGDDGHTYYGNVFGGGSGKDPYAPNKWHEVAGIVRGNTQVDITGGHILTSVYGGNELTDVNGSTTVNFGGTATLGVPRTLEQIAAHPVTCYLFGGGKGDQRIFFNTWTNVKGTNVTITGGRIYGSVFGGGEDGHVLEDAIVNISGTNTLIGTTGTSYVDGNVFGGGRGFSGDAQTAGSVGGNVTLTISGGKMLGSVYGGGRLASVGTQFTAPEDPNYGSFLEDDDNGTHGHVTINISGGIIGNDDENTVIEANGHTTGGNVFGGSMGRLTRLDGSPNELWARLAQVKSSTINISGNATIKSNVYGGAEFGTTRDNVYVTIGGTRETNGSISKDTGTTATINGHVYGGGYGSTEDGAAYYSVIDAGTTKYLFTPMQYAGCVGSNTEVDVVGGHVKRNVYGGGEMASVGVIDYSVQEDENGDITYDNKKYSYINAHKHADIDAPGTTSEKVYGFGLSWPYEFSYIMGGKTTINVEGGRIGTGWDDGKGYVFGGGKGKAFERYKEAHLANVRETEVNIKYATTADPANKETADCVAGAVYGGGEDGHVYEDTKITITGGLIGLSVYGGGKGLGTYPGKLRSRDGNHEWNNELVNLPSWTAGKVYGNTYVTMSDGYVINNVYGGGYNGCVGKGNYASGIDDYYPAGYGETLRNDNLWSPSNNFNPNAAITSTNKPTTMADYFLSSGKCSVTITGGTVGTVNGTYGNVGGVTSMATPTGMVFGGSRGTAAEDVGRLSPRYAYAPDFFLGYVNNTEVIIGIRTVGNPEEDGYVAGSGPTLYGQVFGGGRDGHVRNSAHVIINNGTIGQSYDTFESLSAADKAYHSRHRGNVYGSGSGMGTWNGTNHGTSSGSVTRHTTVDIYGGTIYNNVYGGGAMSSVGPPRLPINDVLPDFAPKDWSSCTVNIYGGNIGVATDYENHEYGSSVFGASRGGENSTGESEDSYATTLWTDVNIMGGSIAGNVFGGGQSGQVKCGVDVSILDGTIGNDVYGGGALAHTNYGNWDATKNNNAGYWAYDEHGAKYKTNVIILGGVIKNHAYGGALGQQMREADDPNGITALDSIPAKVYGDIKVSLNGLELADYTNEYRSYLTKVDSDDPRSDYMVPSSRTGAIVKRVFGCNNMCGTPVGHVKVHVFATQNAKKDDISHKYPKFGDLSEQSVYTITDYSGLTTLATEVETDYEDLDVSAYTTTLRDNNATEKEKQTALENMIVAIARAKYDVQGVYGGGNLAPYVPRDLEIESSEVIIDGCGFTNIYQVYGSGNAASTPATLLQINGTYEVHEAFGGGNGADDYIVYDKEYKNPGANVGYKNYMELDSGTGTTSSPYTWKEKSDATDATLRRAKYRYGTGIAETRVAGGFIHRVYGGSNEKGNIQAIALSSYDEADEDCPLVVDQAYGQSKNAEIDAEVIQNMSCATGVKEIFGGAKDADVNSNITLNITNGSALQRVFGGNNTSGLINGSITVNVRETGCEPIIISEGLYAGGYLADYSIYGYNADRSVRTSAQYNALTNQQKEELAAKGIPYNSPRINVISATSIANIFGGGYEAKVVGNPHVNVNMQPGYVTVRKREKTSNDNPNPDYIYPEGDKYYVYKTGAGVYYHAPNDGDYNELTPVAGEGNENRFTHTLALGSIGNIYGGGNLADIDGDTYVEIGTGEWLNDYWQRETQSSDGHTYTYDNDTKTWSYTVTEGETATTTTYPGNGNPTPTRNKATITGNVFGGGKGVADDFFCRKAMVGAEGSGAIDADGDGKLDNEGGTSVIIANGTVGGNVYGGGEIARVEKNTKVTIGIEGDETNAPTNEPIIEGDVFGAGSGVETHGYSALVRGNPTVTIQGNAKVRGSVYGGGEIASVARYEVVGGSPVALANDWSGNCIVTIRGNAEIGPDNMQMKRVDEEGHLLLDNDGNPLPPHDTGHVFGAGKGVLPGVYTYTDNDHRPKRMIANNQIKEGMITVPVENDPNNSWQYFEDDTEYHAFIETLALASQTNVTIGGNAFVKGSVYGGSLSGIVQYDTHVTIQDHCQIGQGREITTRYENYQGTNLFESNTPPIKSGSGDDVVYYDLECAHWDYDKDSGASYDPFAKYLIDGKYYYANTLEGKYMNPEDGKYYFDAAYKLPVYAEGGSNIAKDGHTYYGNVFGGGSGIIPYAPGRWHRAAGQVRGNTLVEITGGHILTSVYGGNEHTDVGIYTTDTNGELIVPQSGGECVVKMVGGTLGVPRTLDQIAAHPVTCYLFGAGKGDQRIFFNTWTNIINAQAHITGNARIFGSVFGGGEDGHILTDVETNIGGDVEIGETTYHADNNLLIGTTGTSYVDGNVFGAGRGFSGDALTAGSVGGNVTVNIHGGTMLGSIYGGGRLASVGIGFTPATNTHYGQFTEDANGKTYGHVTVNISGGTIGNDIENLLEIEHTKGGNVFGGSMGRLELLDGTSPNPLWPQLAQVKTATVNITGGKIMSNVYGGGEFGTVRDKAYVTIGGTRNNDTGEINATGSPIIYRDVYGGGYGSTINSDNYNAIVKSVQPGENNTTITTIYGFTPMQWAGCVGQETEVNIHGGYIRKSVYGGGEKASVGIINYVLDEARYATETEIPEDKLKFYLKETGNYAVYKNITKHNNVDNSFALSWPYKVEYVTVPNGPAYLGATHINIYGGRIGTTKNDDYGTDNGDVYGGGKGVAGEYEDYVFCANVGSTEVNIDFTEDENMTLDPATYMDSGDCIAGAVYGGGENGHVMGDTHVTLTNGLIGHALYGGGSGKGQFTKWLTMIPEDNREPITNTGSGTPPNKKEDQYEATCYSITAGKVFGNTYVTMKDGYVVRNIYGGGTLGSVGKGSYAGGTDDFSYYESPAKTYNGYGEALQGSLWDNTTDNATTNKFSTAFLNSGKCTVTITGGTVGYIASNPSESIKDGLPYGNVFGGCRGASAPNIGESPRYYYSPEFFLGYANETEVTIGTNGATTGPKILGSVYGGGQDGHVRRDTHVTINSGEIGLAYDQETTAKTNVTKLGTADLDNIQWMARGNVYGAGSGISEYKYDFNYDGDYDDVVKYINPQTGRPSTMKETDASTSAGSVTRFTQVDIVGGIIHRNVYGGGSLASVGPPKIPPTRPDDGDSPRDVSQDRPGHQTLNLVNITGTVGTPDGYAPDTYSGDDSFKYNKVYGGEVYGASRGTDPDNTSLATSVWTEVNLLPGAHVLNNVFGGGDNGMVKQDAVVNVGLPVNITPTSLSFTQKAPINEESNSKTITVGFDAPWTAESSANWLTVTPSGTGGTITVTAADNLPAIGDNTAEERTATITIKGVFGQRTVTVSQAGGGN